MFHILKLLKITNKKINKIFINIIKKVNKKVLLKINILIYLIKLVMIYK